MSASENELLEALSQHDQIPLLSGAAAEGAALKVDAAFLSTNDVRLVPNLLGYYLSTSNFTKIASSKQLLSAFSVCDFEEDADLLLKAFDPDSALSDARLRIAVAALSHQPESVQLQIHKQILQRLPDASVQDLEKIGKMYFKAWAQGMDEAPILADLAHRAVHASSTRILTALRTVLEPLHSSRKVELLVAMYGPLLARSLHVANASVRTNAALLFGDVFPLHESNTDELDGEFLEIFNSMTQDPCVSVRTAACESVCHILHLYSSVLSRNVVLDAVRHVALHSAFDGSSQALRVVAVEGISNLCIQDMMPFIRNVLPNLTPLLRDRSWKIRLETVKVLRKLSDIPGLRFEDIVSRQILESRLNVEEHDRVLKELSDLVFQDEIHGDPHAILEVYRSSLADETKHRQLLRLISSVRKGSRHASAVQGLLQRTVQCITESLDKQKATRSLADDADVSASAAGSRKRGKTSRTGAAKNAVADSAKRFRVLSNEEFSFLLHLLPPIVETFGNVQGCITASFFHLVLDAYGVSDVICDIARLTKIRVDILRHVLHASQINADFAFSKSVMLAMGPAAVVEFVSATPAAHGEDALRRRQKGKAGKVSAQTLSDQQLQCAAVYVQYSARDADADRKLCALFKSMHETALDDDVVTSLYLRLLVRCGHCDESYLEDFDHESDVVKEVISFMEVLALPAL
eukprot:ANDGO_04452.mRNA.1 hypothetical protein